MAREWSKAPFQELLIEPVRNGIYKKKEFHGRGAKIVNMGELFAHPRLRSVPMKRVELNDSEASRFLLKEGDLIFARRSLTAEGAGKCSVVLELDEATTFESSIIRARPNRETANSLFLYYYFNSPSGFHSLDTIRRHVAVAGITGSDLAKLEIPVPPVPEQRAIAHILGTLDDKIELNRRRNQTLEAMARALFKDWFVDFGPVRAKMEGRVGAQFIAPESPSASADIDNPGAINRAPTAWPQPILDLFPDRAKTEDRVGAQFIAPKSPSASADIDNPGAINRAPTTWPQPILDLFPDRLVESEFGEIPEGWHHSTIGEEVTVCGGSTPSTKEPDFWDDGHHRWATPKDLSALKFPVLLDTDRKITDAGLAKISSGLLPVGTVLLSSRAPIGYLAIAEVPTAINQGFIAMKCDGILPNVFVLAWCRESMDAIVGNANGSTFQEISKGNFRPIPIVVPSEPVLACFTQSADSLYRQMAENELESRTLAQLRDTLLPKLISGELRIADAEAFLKERGL